MNYCVSIFSLSSKMCWEESNSQLFPVAAWLWIKLFSLHHSQWHVHAFLIYAFLYLCLHFLSSSFDMLTHERHGTFALMLRYKLGFSFASASAWLSHVMLLPLLHHHTAQLPLLQLLCSHPSTGLPCLWYCTMGIMKWMWKTHSM